MEPNCQSTAIALQILVSHLLGDSGSPYLIGMVSFLWVFFGGGGGEQGRFDIFFNADPNPF